MRIPIESNSERGWMIGYIFILEKNKSYESAGTPVQGWNPLARIYIIYCEQIFDISLRMGWNIMYDQTDIMFELAIFTWKN